jgi:arylsulfatase A-like enzyme
MARGNPIRTLLAGLALVAACCLGACSPARPPNILFIVIDSLRADRLDFYGTQRELTPFLASLAERGNVFWNAYAQSSWTMPSVASLWTSRYQSQHGVTVFRSVLAETEHTIAEVLNERGYTSGAFSANPLLAAQGFR